MQRVQLPYRLILQAVLGTVMTTVLQRLVLQELLQGLVQEQWILPTRCLQVVRTRIVLRCMRSRYSQER